MTRLDKRQLMREKRLFSYSTALERGDFATLAAILREAEYDPLLASMIAEINTVYEMELPRLTPTVNHSTNHYEEKPHMTASVIVSPRHPTSTDRSWLPVTLVAAMLAVALIGTIMLSMRPGSSQNMQAGAQPTASAIHTATLISTATPLPVNSANVTAITGVINIGGTDNLLTVRAAPNATAEAIAALPDGTTVTIIAWTPDNQWLQILLPDGRIGWVVSEVVRFDSTSLIPTLISPSSAAACDSPNAVLISPSHKAEISGVVNVMGIAAAPDFSSYKLEVIGLATGGDYVRVVESPQPVPAIAPLGQIDLSAYGSGTYGLRLSVMNANNQLQASCLITLTYQQDNAAPMNGEATAFQATPVFAFALVVKDTFVYLHPDTNAQVYFELPSGTAVITYEATADNLWTHINTLTNFSVSSDQGQGWVQTEALRLIDPVSLSTFVPTPTAYLNPIIGDGQYNAVTVRPVAVGKIAAGTRVKITAAFYNGVEWSYEIVTSDGLVASARESELTFARDVLEQTPVPLAVTATPIPTLTFTPPPVALCNVINRDSSSLRLYTRPADDAAVIGNLPPQITASVVREERGSDGRVWYLISALVEGESQITGWVRADTITPSAVCPPAP